ncbi:MAG: polysaccharide deacetylase family protein [Ruminococcus sp.]|nr:polysaccharide deacetylase family protein [Ruminococcus sp.]
MSERKAIALTFDDGPDLSATPLVLRTLEQYGVRATFFLIGDNITVKTSGLVRRAVSLGCEIANHSKSHQHMSSFDSETVAQEIAFTDSKIKDITGQETKYFRPPFIDVSETMFQTIDKVFICGLGSDDWDENVPAETIAERVLAQAEDGAIILLHDGEDNLRTPKALETIVPELLRRGYELKTVSELFAAKGIEPKKSEVLYSRTSQTTRFDWEEARI